MNTKNEKIGFIAIVLVLILGICGVLTLDPISQDLNYHQFKDRRIILGIPNFWNVISNLPFLLVGIMGLYSILCSAKMNIIAELKTAYLLFFFSISLIAFGSAYYHLWPDNASLVWDRLPMTIAFMALFSIIICEFTCLQAGKYLLWPLLILGVFSVYYWHSTESHGEGDLRLYILVQFLPMLVIPLILLFFKSKFTHPNAYWLLLLCYVLAKIFEYFDEAIYHVLFLPSGHSLKHIIASVGVFCLFKSYNIRQRI